MNLVRMKALITKEFYQIIKDPSSLLISAFLPVLLLFLYGFAISLDLQHVKVAVVLEDSSPRAQSFLDALSYSRYFDVTVTRNRKEAEKGLLEGDYKGIIVIPSYFTAFSYKESVPAPLQVIADGSEPNTATFVQNYVRGAFLNWLAIQGKEKGIKNLVAIKVDSRIWFNPSLESRNFLVPGSLALILTLIGTLLTSLVIAREWERGTMESLISTPVTMMEIILSKLISYYLLGIFAFILSVVLSLLVYQIPLHGSFFALVGAASIFLTSALGMGLLISTVTKNQFAASQAAIVAAFLPSFFLSGFIYEISTMPAFIQKLTYLIPARYFVSCLQTLFLVGFVSKLIWINMGLMALIGSCFFIMTSILTVKRLD